MGGLLLTEGTHYISCSVGSVAWCDSNTSVVQMATGGGGCSPEIGCATGSACSWNHFDEPEVDRYRGCLCRPGEDIWRCDRGAADCGGCRSFRCPPALDCTWCAQ